MFSLKIHSNIFLMDKMCLKNNIYIYIHILNIRIGSVFEKIWNIFGKKWKTNDIIVFQQINYNKDTNIKY